MMTILFMALGTLIIVNERLNELLVNPVVEYLVGKMPGTFDWSQIIRYTSFVTGMVLGYLFVNPLTEFIAETNGETAVALSPMMVGFFTLLTAGGTQLFHDVWAMLIGVKELAKTSADKAEFDIEIVNGVEGLPQSS